MDSFKIRTFGRKKGRKLSNKKNEQLENVLPNFLIKNEKIFINNFFIANKNIIFEIGFGYGEYTIHKALLTPNSTIIACETYLNGVMSLLNKILTEKEKLPTNIFLYNDDARLLLENLPDYSIDEVVILFPDPWIKHKQNKKRLLNTDFLILIKQKLKLSGKLFFATDILDYANFVIKKTSPILKPLFLNLNDCLKEPENWITTRYQKKAILEGRQSYFMEFKNI